MSVIMTVSVIYRFNHHLFNSWVSFFCSFAGCISHINPKKTIEIINSRMYLYKALVRRLYTNTAFEFIISIVCTRALYRYSSWIYNFNCFRNFLNYIKTPSTRIRFPSVFILFCALKGVENNGPITWNNMKTLWKRIRVDVA